MAALKEILPPAKSFCYDHSSNPWFKQRYGADVVKTNPSTETLPVTVDDRRNLTFVKQNENAKRIIVYSHHTDLIPKILKGHDEEEPQPEPEYDEKQKEIERTTQQTEALLSAMLYAAAQPRNLQTHSQDSKFLKYKPSAAFNSGSKERIIRMVEMPVDPLEPPKFKHKHIPKPNGSPPVPLMHSPPRPLTVQDQKGWKIPPCVSNWKNPKGYTIPLDKRLAADGRGLQQVQINNNFAQLSEALYVAEQQAREAISMRSKVQEEMMMKEKQRKERELRALAQKARSERTGTGPTVGAGSHDVDMMDTDEPTRLEHKLRNNDRDWDPPRETKEEREERIQREKIREERRRERERERRLEAKDGATGKKRKITRDQDRDISEKVALGMASAGSAYAGEVMYDQRLFNQEKGMDSGFATDDQYNVYDSGLFTAQPTLSTLYRPKKDADDEMYGGADEQLEKIRKTDRFKPDKEFTGAGERSGPRDGPVEFEREVAEDADPFGLDLFITQVKGGKKPLDIIGTMRASGGGSRDGYVGSGRTRI